MRRSNQLAAVQMLVESMIAAVGPSVDSFHHDRGTEAAIRASFACEEAYAELGLEHENSNYHSKFYDNYNSPQPVRYHTQLLNFSTSTSFKLGLI